MADKKEFLLHYIGAKTYGMRRLIKEAAVKECQRTIPFNILKGLHYNDHILLAEHRKIEQINQATGETLEKLNLAVCFGYLTITSMSHTLPADISAEVIKRLHIEDMKDYGSSGGMTEERACGSYGIGAVYYVQEDIAEICQIIQQVAAYQGVQLKGVKFFVRGSITKFETPLSIENIKFTRGLYTKLKIDPDLIGKLQRPVKQAGKVYHLYDYSLKTNMTADDAADYDRALAEEYKDAMRDQK